MSWRQWFPEFAVPGSVEKLVKSGVLKDSTRYDHASPNFDAVLSDGTTLTLWVEHPDPDKRIGQMARFGITAMRPREESRVLLETEKAALALATVVEILKTGNWRRHVKPETD